MRPLEAVAYVTMWSLQLDDTSGSSRVRQDVFESAFEVSTFSSKLDRRAQRQRNGRMLCTPLRRDVRAAVAWLTAGARSRAADRNKPWNVHVRYDAPERGLHHRHTCHRARPSWAERCETVRATALAWRRSSRRTQL